MKTKCIVFAMLVALLWWSVSSGATLNLNQVTEASARVRCGSAIGSGTVVSLENGKYWILTNGHVVSEGPKEVGLTFYRRGVKSQEVKGEVVWSAFNKGTSLDFAFITVDANVFGNYPPRVIPVLPSSNELVRGEFYQSAGAPQGNGGFAVEGRILKVEADTCLFRPYPFSGQSGSGIIVLRKDRENIYPFVGGLITWALEEDGLKMGGGVLTSKLRAMTKSRNETFVRIPAHYVPTSFIELQCPGGVCNPFRRPVLPNVPRPQNPVLPNIPRPFAPEDGGNGGGLPSPGGGDMWGGEIVPIPGLDDSPQTLPAPPQEPNEEVEPSVPMPSPVAPLPSVEVKLTFWQRANQWVKDQILGLAGGAIGIYLLAKLVPFVYFRILKPRIVIPAIDRIQQEIQDAVAARYGKEEGVETRAMLEDLETDMHVRIDAFVDSLKDWRQTKYYTKRK